MLIHPPFNLLYVDKDMMILLRTEKYSNKLKIKKDVNESMMNLSGIRNWDST